MTITWNTDVNAPGCPGEILAEDGRSVLVQTDWDYPGVASTFGWTTKSVQQAGPRPDFDYSAECGVLKCEECGAVLYPMEVENGECPDCGGECKPFVPCDHSSTDGTVDCKECGCTAGAFIRSAGEWLSDNDGATTEDPGYFE